MMRNRLKALEKAVQEKTGKGLEFPTILLQLEDGNWYFFDDVGRMSTEELKPVDPRVKYGGGNHYLGAVGFEKENEELAKFVLEHKLSFHDNIREFPNSF